MVPTTDKSEYAQALDQLTRYLASHDHSLFELKTKLSRRFPEKVVAQAVAKARTLGFLKSEDTIAQDAAENWTAKGKSWLYIEAQLRKRHLPIPARDDEKELANARNWIERKFLGALSQSERAAAYRFLRNRGFEDRTIRMVMDVDQE